MQGTHGQRWPGQAASMASTSHAAVQASMKRATAARQTAAAAAPARGQPAARPATTTAVTMPPAILLAAAPGLVAQTGGPMRMSTQLWGAAAIMRQHTNMAPHMMLQQAMGQALVGPAMMHTAPSQLDEAEATQQFAAAMAGAAQTMKKAHVESTVRARHRVASDAQQCFTTLPASWGVNLATAGPEHIIYWAQQYVKEHAGELRRARPKLESKNLDMLCCTGLTAPRCTMSMWCREAQQGPSEACQWWDASHAGTVLPDGSEVAAPGTLESALSHLSTSMKTMGRQGPWDEDSRTGNPTESTSVRLYRRGYERQLRELGYEEGSAVPWLEGDVHALVDQMDKEAAAYRGEAELLIAAGKQMSALRPTMQSLLLDRDATAAVYEWWGLQRGKECGALSLADFKDEQGQEIISRLPAMLMLAPEKLQASTGRLLSLPLPLQRAEVIAGLCYRSQSAMPVHHTCSRLPTSVQQPHHYGYWQ